MDEDLERLIGEGGCKEQLVVKELIVRQLSWNFEGMKRQKDYFTIQCQKPYVSWPRLQRFIRDCRRTLDILCIQEKRLKAVLDSVINGSDSDGEIEKREMEKII